MADDGADVRMTIRRFTAFDYDHPALGGVVYASGATMTGAAVALVCRRLRLPHSDRISGAVAVLGCLLVLWDRVASHGVVKRRIADAPGEPPRML